MAVEAQLEQSTSSPRPTGEWPSAGGVVGAGGG